MTVRILTTALAALAITACASSRSITPDPMSEAAAPNVLPEALQRAAYDAPEWNGDPVAPPVDIESQIAYSGSFETAVASGAYNPEASWAQRNLPDQAGPVGLPQGPQRLDFPTDPNQRAEVPRAPQLARAAYEPVADFDGLDPIVITENRARRGVETSARPESTPTRPAAPVETPRRGYQAAATAAAAAPIPSSNPARPAEQRATPATFTSSTVSVLPESARVAPTPERPALNTTSGRYGVHIASYRDPENVARGLTVMQNRYPELLRPLQSRASQVTIPGRGDFLRLLVGPFSAPHDAEALCTALKSRDEYCEVRPFVGVPVG